MSEGSFTTEVPVNFSNGAPPPSPAPGAAVPSFIDTIGTDYKDKPWAQDFSKKENPFSELAKAYEGAQSLLGKKSSGIEIPGADATPEAIQNFHKAIGVPEKPDGYEYKLPDLSKEPEPIQKLMQSTRDEAFTNAMKQAAHTAGMTPKQFQAMANAMDGHQIGLAKAALEAKTNDANSALTEKLKVVKSIYGDGSDEVQDLAKDTLAKVLPDNVKATGDAEIMVLELAKYIHENLFQGDKINKITTAPIETGGDLRSQIMALRATKDARGQVIFQNETHPQYPEIKAQIAALYKKEADLTANRG